MQLQEKVQNYTPSLFQNLKFVHLEEKIVSISHFIFRKIGNRYYERI